MDRLEQLVRDPSVSLPSRPCITVERSACELSGRYEKVRFGRLIAAWGSLQARIPAAVWLAVLVAIIVGVALTSLGMLFEPSLASASETTIVRP